MKIGNVLTIEFCRGGRPWLFRLGILLLVGSYPRTKLVHRKDFGWMVSGSWTQKCWVFFGWRSLQFSGGGVLQLKDSIIGKGSPARFELYPGICFTTEEKYGKPQSASRAAIIMLFAPTWLSFEGQPRLACCSLLRLRYPWIFSQPLVGTSAFKVAVLRGSPHQLTSSRNSGSVLWCVRPRMESPDAREFACCQPIKVR
jgi:hypothetical protein